jgi:hypothetical protein
MSRLAIPLQYRTLWATGDVLVSAYLDLLLKTNTGTWEPATFRADSGAEITTMPAWDARVSGLPMPQRASPGVRHEQTGLEVRSGWIRAQVVGMDATEYVFPCFFLGDPHTPLSAYSKATTPRSLLGLAGVVDKLLLAYNGMPAPPLALYGHLIIEKL